MSSKNYIYDAAKLAQVASHMADKPNIKSYKELTFEALSLGNSNGVNNLIGTKHISNRNLLLQMLNSPVHLNNTRCHELRNPDGNFHHLLRNCSSINLDFHQMSLFLFQTFDFAKLQIQQTISHVHNF